jgi:hypothetical protein
MQAAEEAIGKGALESQASLVMLALFILGLAAMAWLTAREASLYEDRKYARTLSRNRKRKAAANIPARERLTAYGRLMVALKMFWLGRDFSGPIADASGAEDDYRERLRREIDKLAGKEVYHGQKEQL